MSRFRRRTHSVPGLNTSSLPDLIFTVLFFFMIVTHMRKTVLKVHFQVPQGTELTRLTKKSAVSYIYIGKPSRDMQALAGTEPRLHWTDNFASAETEQNRMSPEDRQQMTVSIKADKHTKMHVMTDVKQALRQAKALRISYSAVSRK